MLKVYRAIPTFNDTVVFSSLLGAGNEIIYHYNKEGTLLWQFVINDLFDTLCMPNDHLLVYLRPEEKKIHIIDLKTHKRKTLEHEYLTDVSCQCYLDYFCETGLLCVRENGDHHLVKVHFTYYKLEDIMAAE